MTLYKYFYLPKFKGEHYLVHISLNMDTVIQTTILSMSFTWTHTIINKYFTCFIPVTSDNQTMYLQYNHRNYE